MIILKEKKVMTEERRIMLGDTLLLDDDQNILLYLPFEDSMLDYKGLGRPGGSAVYERGNKGGKAMIPANNGYVWVNVDESTGIYQKALDDYGSWSIDFWIKRTDEVFSSRSPGFSLDHPMGTVMDMFYYQSSGKFEWMDSVGTEIFLISPHEMMEDLSWHHMAIQSIEKERKFYFDGGLEQTYNGGRFSVAVNNLTFEGSQFAYDNLRVAKGILFNGEFSDVPVYPSLK